MKEVTESLGLMFPRSTPISTSKDSKARHSSACLYLAYMARPCLREREKKRDREKGGGGYGIRLINSRNIAVAGL
jgi:hypothetical protein